MTTRAVMPSLREAATQALEAMLSFPDDISDEMFESITALKAALAEPVQEPVAFDHGIGADRFRVVRGAYWWHVLIGESTAKHGKFHTQAGAEEMAALLLREFRNGAFVQHKAAPPQRKPEPNSDYERGFVDGMSEQARRSVDKAVNAMIKCKPLAEEEIARLVTNDMVKFARAIERAHGIV